MKDYTNETTTILYKHIESILIDFYGHELNPNETHAIVDNVMQDLDNRIGDFITLEQNERNAKA